MCQQESYFYGSLVSTQDSDPEIGFLIFERLAQIDDFQIKFPSMLLFDEPTRIKENYLELKLICQNSKWKYEEGLE